MRPDRPNGSSVMSIGMVPFYYRPVTDEVTLTRRCWEIPGWNGNRTVLVLGQDHEAIEPRRAIDLKIATVKSEDASNLLAFRHGN